MIYSYITSARPEYTFFTLIYMIVSLVIGGLCVFFLHDIVQMLLVKPKDEKPDIKRIFFDVLKSPDTWISIAVLCFCGVAWRKQKCAAPEKRGKAFFVALAGPLTCFVLSIVAFVFIRLSLQTDILYLMYFFKALFRAAFYTSVASLIPIMPLDGGYIIYSIIPERIRDFYARTGNLPEIIMPAAAILLTVAGYIPQIVI